MNIRYARMQGEKLAEKYMGEAPVDVKKIANKLGLKVIYANLGSEVSGLLVSNDGGAQICVQERDHIHRQRFTIAHEIGHHFLGHQLQSGEHVIVDRGNYISQRGPRASDGVDPKEIEANQFAACLLMPTKLVNAEAKSLGTPLFDVDVSKLADKFQVSEQAMTIRLIALGLL